MDPLVVTAIATVLLTIFTAGLFFVASFKDWIRDRKYRAELDLEVVFSPPHSHKTYFSNPETGQFLTNVYYFKLNIWNKGNIAAKSVEVFTSSLKRKAADETLREISSFLPMNLVWSHLKGITYPSINPGSYRHCDLGYIIDPDHPIGIEMVRPYDFDDSFGDKIPFALDQIVKPNTKGHLIGPGEYHLEVVLSASNAKSEIRTIYINHTGDWYDE